MLLHSVSCSRVTRLAALCALGLMLLGVSTLGAAQQAPGGFLESDATSVTRPLLTPAQIAGFMPSRGAFTFPAPYNTQGVRITNADDCGGQDCVDMIYSYWRNMSNSVGSNVMYLFVGLDRNRGGQGPTLFKFDKTTNQLTKVGPLFDAASPYSWNSAEGWYFSYGMPTKLYLQDGSRLLRYDVLAHTFETVFDSTTQYPNTVIRQTNSSNDDDVHSATLEQAGSYAVLGCMAYKVSTRQFFFYPATGDFDECQIDKSGRYLVIKERTPATCTTCEEDNVIVDLQTGIQTTLLDQNGAGGHSDLGYGYMVAQDNQNSQANAWRLWNLALNPVATLPLGIGGLLQGALLYHDSNWNVAEPSHISFENADPATPINQQYACGSSANLINSPHANEVVCFMLNDSGNTLVVAPVMTDVNATGGNATCPGCEDYAKDPKGNIDPTGQYFFWTSNMGGNRLDAFMVKIPSQVLTDAPSDTTPPPPVVTITSPENGATLSGSVIVSATATAAAGIASVEFVLDGNGPSTTLEQTPYSVSWDTSSVAPGTHTLTAIARDADGNTTKSEAVTITIEGDASSSPPPPPPASGSGSSGQQHGASQSGGGGLGGFGVLLLWLMFNVVRMRRGRLSSPAIKAPPRS